MAILAVNKDDGSHVFWCPGCQQGHMYPDDGRWSFNGDFDKPTFNPSLLNTMEYGDDRETKRCHLYVSNAKIQYLNDCTHDLAGETVDMIDMEDI